MSVRAFGRYPAYRESEYEWLGEIPDHWDLKPVKHLCSFAGGSTPAKENLRYWDGGTVPWVSPKDMKVFWLSETQDKITETAVEESSVSLVAPGALLMVVRSGILQRTIPVAMNTMIVTLNQDMKALIFSRPKCAEYFAYLVQGHDSALLQRWTKEGATVESVEHEFLANDSIPDVPADECRAIVAFLDYETAKIDALIEKQQQLIALLKEKRQAVISHAVTKGLNPDAPMRDSGVEWLGEVPAHWEVSKFGFISSVVRGGSPRPAGDPTLFNGDYSPWVTVAEITKDDEITLTETTTFLTKKGSIQCRVFKAGTLLLSNSGATLGVPKVLMIDANANDGVVGFEYLKHHREYCYYYLSSLTEDLRERIKQGSGQPNLNTDIVKAINVPVPPPNETDAIVRHISVQREKFKQLAEKAELGIDLLQERRTALISAAVTGKIDVRGWKAPSDSREAT